MERLQQLQKRLQIVKETHDKRQQLRNSGGTQPDANFDKIAQPPKCGGETRSSSPSNKPDVESSVVSTFDNGNCDKDTMNINNNPNERDENNTSLLSAKSSREDEQEKSFSTEEARTH